MIASWNKYVYVRHHFLHCLFLFSEVQVAKPGLSHFLSMWFLFESAEALGLRCIFNEDAVTDASYVLCFCVDRQRLRIPHMRGIYLPSWLAGQRLMSCLLGTHILHACVLPKHMFPSSVIGFSHLAQRQNVGEVIRWNIHVLSFLLLHLEENMFMLHVELIFPVHI